MLNDDYRDMLRALSDEGASFLLVGAYAMAAHGYLRATGRTRDLADAEALEHLLDGRADGQDDPAG